MGLLLQTIQPNREMRVDVQYVFLVRFYGVFAGRFTGCGVDIEEQPLRGITSGPFHVWNGSDDSSYTGPSHLSNKIAERFPSL